MTILALETSGASASAALFDGIKNELIAEMYIDGGLKASRTLMPMTDAILKTAGMEISDIGLVAAAVGPGSFTGLRIGIASAKGIAFGRGIPAVGVSTLEALSVSAAFFPGLICCALDARREQVYTAIFEGGKETPKRLLPDAALSFGEVLEEIKKREAGPVFLMGDGAGLLFEYLGKNGVRSILAPPNIRFQRAAGVAMTAARECCMPLVPAYIRLPQAERERLERKGKI